MRQSLPLLVAGSLVASVATAQEPPPNAAGSSSNTATGTTSSAAASEPATSTSDNPAKPSKRVKRKAKKRKAVKGPVANYPSFRVLPDGSSRIHVEISEKVIVAERKAEGRVAYRIKGASVPISTNLLPLETSFFKTPVARVMLVEVGDEDVELVVEFRQPSAVTYKVVDTDAGAILQVDVPAPAAPAPTPAPAK